MSRSGEPPIVRTISGWAVRLGAAQGRGPGLFLAICAVLALLGGGLARRLELRTRFDQLLPDAQPSVVELRRVMARTASATTIYAVLDGDDTQALRAFGDAVLAPLRALGPETVSSASDGLQGARTFLMQRSGLFQTTAELERLRADVDARWDYEVAKQDGSLLDEDSAPPPPLTAAELKKRFEGKQHATESAYPDGYFQSKDGKSLVVVIATPVPAGDLAGAGRVLERVKATIGEVQASRWGAVRVSYAGDLVTGLSEYGAVSDDLLRVGVLGFGLVLGVVVLFFARLRALVALGATLLVGLAWTFGLTAVTIGHLNVATGFLFSIVAGNGINTGIVYLQRYYEERRSGRSAAEAIVITHRTTWLSTCVAALAAGASYGSLVVTDFRAFKHFAVIGAAGMVLCWLATVLVLPSLLVVIDRGPFEAVGAATAPRHASLLGRMRKGLPYQAPFVAMVRAAPRVLACAGVVLAVGAAVAGALYFRKDPMEYDMRKLQNESAGPSAMYRAVRIAERVVGAKLDSSMVVLCDRLEQVRDLKAILEARRDAAPADEKPLEAVHTIFDFVPLDQEAKLPTLDALAARMRRARERQMIADADWAEIEPLLPPEDLKAFGITDLPEELAHPFTERDGTRGTLVLVEPTAGRSDSDLQYLMKYSAAFRETTLKDGSVVRGSGRVVIFSDMLETVRADIPKAIGVSLAMTLVAVILVFGLRGPSLAVLGSLAVGLALLAGYFVVGHVRVNFFNFIALPITFGIGVDYAVNLMQRYVADGERRSILAAMQTTGGAVVLCSMTTTLGYLALLGSMNQAIRSLGLVAVAGELTCLASAMLVLAGWLRWRETRARAAERPCSAAAEDR